MRILAIDTTAEICSTSLWDNGNCFSHTEKCHRRHTQRILPLIKEILSHGNISLTDLDGLAFNRGPGGFTGVRIGICIAKGLALGIGLPIIGISKLLIMAQNTFRYTGATHVLVAINARIGEVYWAKYIRDKKGIWYGEETEALHKIEEINASLKMLSGEWALTGTGWKSYPEILRDNNIKIVNANTLSPTAEDILPIACQFLEIGKTVEVGCAEPVYLQNKVIWKKLPNK